MTVEKLRESGISSGKILDYIGKDEQFAVSLSDAVLENPEHVHVFSDKGLVLGVFLYTPGQVFTCFIRNFSSGIERLLEDFFSENEVFCLHGEKSQCAKIIEIISRTRQKFPLEHREMFLMEFSPESEQKSQSVKTEIFRAGTDDAESIMPLQLAFAREEAVPYWKKVFPALERMALDKKIRSGTVYAASVEGTVVSKAYFSSRGKNVWQIGGIYTEKDWRGKGIARDMARKLSETAAADGKKAVLFVRKENSAALRCYGNAGFRIFGEYSMSYYDDSDWT